MYVMVVTGHERNNSTRTSINRLNPAPDTVLRCNDNLSDYDDIIIALPPTAVVVHINTSCSWVDTAALRVIDSYYSSHHRKQLVLTYGNYTSELGNDSLSEPYTYSEYCDIHSRYVLYRAHLPITYRVSHYVISRPFNLTKNNWIKEFIHKMISNTSKMSMIQWIPNVLVSRSDI